MARKEDIDILSRTLFGESEANNQNDAKAIASVILNRTKFPNWSNNVAAVCLQAWQFSCWNQNDPNRQRILNAKGAWFEKCKVIAQDAVDGKISDPTNGSTHYYATYVKMPKWAKGKTPVYEVKHGKGIGSHIFFNNIDTKPPVTAKDALDEKRPLTATRTMKTSQVAAAATGTSIAIEILDKAQPAIPLLQTLAEYAPMVLGAVALGAIAFIAYIRWDDRKNGVH